MTRGHRAAYLRRHGSRSARAAGGGRRVLRRDSSATDLRHSGTGPRRALPGAAFAIDGDAAALEWAGRIAHLLGGETLRILPEHRALYHAAAVMASNYVVALVDAAAMLMDAAGISEDKALRAIGTAGSRRASRTRCSLGPVEALTGPIQRGDVETVCGHLRALAPDAGIRARVLSRRRTARPGPRRAARAAPRTAPG